MSDDRKNVRCQICEARHGKNGGWIQKESLAYHLKSEAHAHCLRAQQNRESVQAARDQVIREESAVEERMEFAILSSAIKPTTTKARLSKPSQEEQEMWDNYETSHVTFNAGVDPELAAIEERKKLALEAINLDIWHGTDFLPEEDPNNGEQLLDDLEQEDILNELLRNAREWYLSSFCF